METIFLDHIQNARRGSDAGWRYLVASCYPRLLSRCIRYAHGDMDTAKELLSSFWLFVIEKDIVTHKFSGSSLPELVGYLRVCLRNFYFRQRDAREIADQEYIEKMTGRGTADGTDDAGRVEAIDRAIECLDPRYREVIVLQMNAYKQREIAVILGSPINTISSHSRRAKIILRDHLRKSGITHL